MIDFDAILGNLRGRSPLVHCITNYVTVNDCANILLACGASPVMSDDPDEVEEITSIADALTVNIGTLNRHTVPSMLLAGKRADALGRPVVLDPVGAGASKLRTETAKELLGAVRFAAVRCNVSELRALAQGAHGTRGVDAEAADSPGAAGPDGVHALAGAFAEKVGAVVAVTGATDVVTDGTRACVIRNGNALMRRVTGTGCMLSAMTAAYLAANPESPFEAACAAVIAMGVCGELAFARMSGPDGSAAYRGYLIDAVYNLTAKQLEEGARYEMR
ncbi:MAG: hydroxyethylthiazole kinase [Ruminococcaceae bacterium]|nr:hydroxyethylthiazole kinase [Oscillospiraceae bacterium]